MVDKFGAKGFVVVGVTDESEFKVEKYLEDTKWKAIIAIDKKHEAMRAYGFDGFPSSVLVGPKGKILWTGHPAGLEEEDIKDELKRVRMSNSNEIVLELDKPLPEKYSSITKKIEKRKFGAAARDLEKVIRRARDEELATLKAALRQIEGVGMEYSALADSFVEQSRFYDARDVWQRLYKRYAGHRVAKAAKIQLGKLARNKAARIELAAGKQIAAAKDYWQKGKKDKARATLQRILKGSLKASREAARAKIILEKLNKEK